MGFSAADSSTCTRHPKHKHSPGVCSSCLTEKLSKLSISPSTLSTKKTYVVSGSSSFSSTPSASSTVPRKSSGSGSHRHRRNGSETYVSVGMMLNNGLKKSRSVSCAPLSSRSTKLGPANYINNDVINEKCKSGEVDTNNLKKKNGFLKKLMHTTGKKTKGVLLQSKTMRERSSSSSSSTTTNKI